MILELLLGLIESGIENLDIEGTADGASSSVKPAAPTFGAEIPTRFDVDAISPDGNAVGSDAAGNLIDKQTGEALSKY